MSIKIKSRMSRFALGLHGIRLLSLVVVSALVLSAPALLAGDIGMVALLKGQHYEQTGPDLVTLVEKDESGDDIPLMLTAFVQGTAPGVVTNGLLKLPDNSSVDLIYDEYDAALNHEFGCETLLDLDLERPNGDYTFIVPTANDGVYSNTLSLTGNQYPAMPLRVINFTALQTITNVNQEITIQWEAIPGCTSNDFIKVAIEGPFEMEWSTPEFGQPGALTGTNTCVTLPANTLTGWYTYDVEIMVARAVDIKQSPVLAVAAYYVRTELEIHTTPPAKFDASIPGMYGATVPVSSTISFRFTQPMNTGFMSVSWAGTNLNPNSFTYSWCDNNRVLLCSYSGGLPENSDISWTLNLASFKDALGNSIDGEAQGWFRTVPDEEDMMNGAFLFKSRGYRQRDTTPEIMGYEGEVEVELVAFNMVLPPVNLSVSNKVYTLEEEAWEPEYYLEAGYTSKDQLDAFFPNSTYTLTLPLYSGGSTNMTLDLGTEDAYPDAPTITDLAGLQNLNPSNAIVISWITLADFLNVPTEGYSVIEVEICDEESGEELYSFEVGDTNITASAITIPANTLWPGRTYAVEVIFTKLTYLEVGMDAFAIAGFSSLTEITIQTAGTPILPLPNMQLQAGGVNITYEGGELYRRYVVETSTDLVRWIPQYELRAEEGSLMSYTDYDAQFLSSRFYRLRDWVSEDGWIEPPVSIQGTVWTDSSRTTPVVGALVGTDLDGQVTTTDNEGRFFLETETFFRGEELPYTITVRSGEGDQDFGSDFWGHHPRNQEFIMQGTPE